LLLRISIKNNMLSSISRRMQEMPEHQLQTTSWTIECPRPLFLAMLLLAQLDYRIGREFSQVFRPCTLILSSSIANAAESNLI
jgi:hypothetical protein